VADINDTKQHLERCIQAEQERESKEINQFKILLLWFISEIQQVKKENAGLKQGIVTEAKEAYNNALRAIKEQRQKRNRVIRRFIYLIVFLLISWQGIIKPIAYQVCKYNNVEPRTYAIKEQCR
jgi:hypothetical protein